MKVSTLLSSGLFSVGALATAIGSTCKCFPGDACWPSTQEWNKLNQTVFGRLIATTPLAEACHGDKYDSAKCASLQSSWQTPDTQ